MGTWELGWDSLVAVGTLALALFTARLARQTTALARETARDVRSTSRPVLINPADLGVAMEFGGNRDTGALAFTIENAGPGPALNAYAYTISTTSTGDVHTTVVNVGNFAPEQRLEVKLQGIPNLDTGKARDRYLAIRAFLGYSDVAGARYHTIIRLSDPNNGAPRTGAVAWEQLTLDGSTVGEGNVPPQQWRVTFRGQEPTDDQRRRLRAAAIQYSGGHGAGGGAWSSTVFVFAPGSPEAIERVKNELGGASAPFADWSATPWAMEPLVFSSMTRWERAREVGRRLWRRFSRR